MYYHGMYQEAANKFNTTTSRIKRIYENLEFYKEAIIAKQK